MQEVNYIPLKRKKRKKGNIFGYIILFAFVFILALYALSYIVKSYSPNVDVTLGNDETLALSEEDMDVEIKPIDERLKWIQMEDDLPSVSVRVPQKLESENNSTQKETIKDSKKKTAPIPSEEDLKNAKIDFKFKYDENKSKPIYSNNEKNEKPEISEKNTLTKIYLGHYATIEDAMNAEQKVSKDITEVIPFIKNENGKYIVQIGSFSDKEKANALVKKMKLKGYNPKIINQ